MLGGDWYDDIEQFEQNQDKLVEKCLQMCSKYLQINQKPINHKITINKVSQLKIENGVEILLMANCFIFQNAIPQYRLGHHLKIKKIEQLIAKNNLNLSLAGNSYYGISVNECIGIAEKTVNDYFDRIKPI
jgi:hypothetical protein